VRVQGNIRRRLPLAVDIPMRFPPLRDPAATMVLLIGWIVNAAEKPGFPSRGLNIADPLLNDVRGSVQR
jgi:hypothetical protein